MAERSFAAEVRQLRNGAGTTLHVEGILAVTKALLQSGVAYVGGYQGAPISHLMDVLGDAHEILDELGVYFENSASEATAAAMLAASVHYPLRGAVTFKSTVGLNVASDALANLASGGVTGGALVILGEDYGEGSSIMQERSHAFAMKSQMWLLDPRPNVSAIVDAVETGFELSEASNTPVMLDLRLRSCHLHGAFEAKDNKRPPMTVTDALENPLRDIDRIVLPPASFLHEKEKIHDRWPAAVKFIKDRGLNEVFGNDKADIGIIVQGGLYNTLNRSMELLGCSDAFGRTQVPTYVMNVTYPVIDDEIIEFCQGKRAVLLLEEGQPDYIEQNLNAILRRADIPTALHGKDMLTLAGEYTSTVVTRGVNEFLQRYLPDVVAHQPALLRGPDDPASPTAPRVASEVISPRPPGLCTGCPERPIFSGLKLAERETGKHHVSADIGCHLFAVNAPFDLGATTMGYGLGSAGASALNSKGTDRRSIAIMGDGGFWHNGLTSGVGNAVFNKSDQVHLIVDNAYAAATGGQDVLSSQADLPTRSTQHPIEKAVRGIGVKWARTIKNTYDVGTVRDTFVEALTTDEAGPKVLVMQSECQLNAQRRVKRDRTKALAAGKRVVRERFGVDPETCTGDHACIRISGCPSLTIAPNPDPMRTDPIAEVLDSCVGCGVCGANAHAAVLCPSFYRTDVVDNPTRREQVLVAVRSWWIKIASRGLERRAARFEAA
ncbi:MULTISPECIES: indolepyruvate ferredoxin oxidoreductase subunit alpha [unclassified Rhodococcus (in: high G+C Gram-positive bacteria)]|uniref:thiamine pyrophosphate-dependent enzyme n=1 Tax=unclassified Rhodococcus (in: high G+C Gram-positive bacteria) TaxID=192944 RepID=UPI0016399A7E|nr:MULTISPECIES: indolepyruvate ferredoxin oxidoreductase subunit alpha [unclassified Rhodococcus (in: high G+C Gram-positive bacteria)]MBC2642611.1 indolepyruvate ferredoxin oxidoreductase subunit alpha [Rhodococcus sp. 3A]MBC2892647.1 indolepyruvate ferredoxin oxidoreductase subunit alpha [Rhodococcus sp. 4CII]